MGNEKMNPNEYVEKLTELSLLDDGFNFQVPKRYIQMAGDLKSGILLGCINHLTTRVDPFKIIDNDGSYWIYRRKEDWHSECALSVREATRCLKILTQKNLIETRKITPVEIMNIVKHKNPQQLKDPFAKIKICCWCNSETYVLHDHHYPVTAKSNGSDTIQICANCHSEYHFLKTVTLIRINKEKLNGGKNGIIMFSTSTKRPIGDN